MRTFKLKLSGDYLNPAGQVDNGYYGEDIYESAPYIQTEFLLDQSPVVLGSEFAKQLYSFAIKPEDVDGLSVITPYVKRETFDDWAHNLVVIGRAGVGTDKIDLKVCPENNIAVFDATDSITHSTALASMTLLLALTKWPTAQDRMARSGICENQAKITGDDLMVQTLGIIGMAGFHVNLFACCVISYACYCIFSPLHHRRGRNDES